MKTKAFFSLLFVLLFYEYGHSTESPDSIFAKSARYYRSVKSGVFTVSHSYKPSNTESYSESVATISFCGRDLVRIRDGNLEKILTRKSYLYINHISKDYFDYSRVEDIIPQQYDYVNGYPYFNERFFEGRDFGKFKVVTVQGIIRVFAVGEEFEFSETDYSLLRYRRTTVEPPYGVSVNEFKIISKKHYEDCPPSINDLSFLNLYKKKDVGKHLEKKKPDLKGQQFSKIFTGKELTLSDGSILKLDSLKGRFILFDFFYQACKPCIMGFQFMKKIGLQPSVTLTIIGVDHVLADAPSLERFKKHYQLLYPIVTGKIASELDTLFNPRGVYPVYMLIDPKGQIVEIFEGFREEFLEKVRKKVSKE
ncbi:MAG: TlpA family protein disulfide reductase [Flavitalea sp.]